MFDTEKLVDNIIGKSKSKHEKGDTFVEEKLEKKFGVDGHCNIIKGDCNSEDMCGYKHKKWRK